jgi:signal transduction histidine kinase
MDSGVIYCVDDDVDILSLYQIILDNAGHEVSMLSSGEEALAAIYKRNPDLIILDEKMSDCSGMEICQRVRNDKSLPFIPIIMVTGVDSKEGKIKSLEEGIDDYILKPFDHEELLAKVMVMLRIKRLYTDLLQTRKNLVQAEKMAAVGQLAAAMAHEIRNPLSVIAASVQFLKGKVKDQDETLRIMDTILRKISEIDGTIRELLAVARPLKLKNQSMDLNACVQEVVGFIKEKCLVQRVDLNLYLQDNLPPILGDEEHLQRVWLNILINALNSMPQGGALFVTTEAGENDTVQVVIKDTGEGIQPEDISHLFEPFFSRRAGGSGLGLFVVKMIIDELKGHIDVRSKVSQGTVFTVSLPRLREE